MTHTDKTNTTKSNTYDSQSQNANTEESYSNFMYNMEYFSVFGFLLAGLANYMIHEKRMSD